MEPRTRERFSVTLATGEQIRGLISFTGSPSHLAIVYVHGFGGHCGGDKSLALEEACARRGLCFAAFDFRGHGRSDGTLRELRASKLLEDMAAVRHYLLGRGIERIGLVGSSMGGWAALWFALQAGEVHACVVLAPASRFLQRRWESLTEAEQEAWERDGIHHFTGRWVHADLEFGFAEERHAFRPEALADRWHKPLLIFHGMADDIVDHRDSLAFIEATRCPRVQLHLLKDGDHRLTAYKDFLAEESCRFLADET